MTRFEILIELNGVRYQLDTYKEEPISLTYNVADISDISARNSSYSKTIKLPETQNNRQIFGNIGDLSVSSTFNPNKKTRAWILVDSIVVFEGYLQLRNVVDDLNVDYKEYEVVIFAENDNLFKSIGDKYLTDMDFSNYNHDWTKQNIINSWTASWDSGYFYPLIDYGYDWEINDINGVNGEVKVSHMYPATNAKVIFDRIFTEAGYSYQSDFLNSDEFKNLYIPFNGDAMSRTATYSQDKIFRVGFNSDLVIYNGATYTTVPNNPQFTSFTMSFDNETSPNGDPNGLWNTTLYEYTQLDTDNLVQSFSLRGEIFIPSQFGLSNISGRRPRIVIYRSRTSTGATSSNWATGTGVVIPATDGGMNYFAMSTSSPFNCTTQFTVGVGTTYSFNLQTPFLNNSQTNRYPLFPGEKVRVVYQFAATSYSGSTTIPAGVTFSIIDNSTIFWNNIAPDLIPTQTIDYNSAIPKNFKQKDFITSIIKMFNLYIEPSKEFDKVLFIEPRNDYYDSGVIKDWTRKLDTLKPIDIKILGETQNKTTRLMYKPDSDYYNEFYIQYSGGVNYGEYIHFIDNDFISGEKKIEIAFSPTPAVSLLNSSQLVIPVIGKVDNNTFKKTKHNVRILQKYTGGVLPVVASSDNWKFEGTTLTSYPYLGHYDNPQSPTFDINFGQVAINWAPEETVTNDTLYELYWKEMIDEISDMDSRIITADFYLTPQDIANFKFNDKIFIDNQYYKVNKISNYDPTREMTCSVELIKTKFIDVPRRRRRQIIVRPVRPVRPVGPVVNPTPNGPVRVPPRTLLLGENFVDSPNNIINGASNSVASIKSYTGGDNNLLEPDTKNIIISGDNNTVRSGSSASMISGANNTIDEDTYNVFVFGDNITATESNTLYTTNLSITGNINGVPISTILSGGVGATGPTGPQGPAGSGSGARTIGTYSGTVNMTTDVALVYTTGPSTIYLPTAVGVTGSEYTIKDRSGNAKVNNIVVSGTSSQLIDGSVTYTMRLNYESITVVSDGSAWWII